MSLAAALKAARAVVHAPVRSRVPALDEDRPPSADIEAIAGLIATGEIEDACGSLVK
jgi:histidine ammonia-lyase